MFDEVVELVRRVDELRLGVDGDEIVAVLGAADRLTAKAVAALGEFDAAGLWSLDGATSLTAWVTARTGYGPMARMAAARARQLRRLPITGKAWCDGRLSGDQVRVVMANVPEHHVDRFASHEAALVPTLEALDVRGTERAMNRWRELADAESDCLPPERSGLHHHRLPDGTWRLDGTLDDGSGQTVAAALQAARTADVRGETPRTATQRRADALVALCSFFLAHGNPGANGRHRPQLNVLIDVESLLGDGCGGELVDGVGLAARRLEELSCDAVLSRLVMSGRSLVLDYGRVTKIVPDGLFRAVAGRDRGCRFPGCDRPVSWCHAHHIRHWRRGGHTRIDNLVLLCGRHHSIIHKSGWNVELRADGTVEVHRPDGGLLVGRPPPLRSAA